MPDFTIVDFPTQDEIEVGIDGIAKGVTTIDAMHRATHEGEAFIASHLIAHGSELANDATLELLIFTGANNFHLQPFIEMGGHAEWQLFEDATHSENNEGTTVPVLNMNRWFADDASAEGNTVTVTQEPSGLTADGTQIFTEFLPGGAGPKALGGSGGGRFEVVLLHSSIYLLRVTNRSGNAQMGSVVISGYEKLHTLVA